MKMVGDAASLPHQERVLMPFFVSRNVGAKILHVIANQRMTMAAGVFNDWWIKGDALSDSGTDVTVRVTALPVDSKDGTRFPPRHRHAVRGCRPRHDALPRPA